MTTTKHAELKGVRLAKSRIRDQQVALLQSKEKEVTRTEDNEADGTFVAYLDHFEAEDWEKQEKLIKEFDTLASQERILESELEVEELKDKQKDMVGDNAAAYLQAKVDADCYKNLLAVGHNDYTAPGRPAGLQEWTAAQYCMPTPLVAKDSDGRNRVYPMPAIFSEDQSDADIEASFRAGAIIRAGKVGEYDLKTGNKLEGASTITAPVLTTDAPNAIPVPVQDLWEYMILEHRIHTYCNIIQTPGLGKLPIQRRTDIPEAGIVGTKANIGQNVDLTVKNIDFSEVELAAYKFGFLSNYSYEATMTLEPWSIAAQVAKDGGTGLGNGIGKMCATGNGTSQPEGVLTAVKGDTNQHITGVAHGSFLAGTNAFDVEEIGKIWQAIPDAYATTMMKMILRRQTWLKMITVMQDANNLPILLNMDSRVMSELIPDRLFDQNWDDGDAADEMPIVFGNLDGHVVRFAGPVRVEFSPYEGWTKDILTYKFVHYCDAKQIDPNMTRGYEVQT